MEKKRPSPTGRVNEGVGDEENERPDPLIGKV
jgi:hypothetical protein